MFRLIVKCNKDYNKYEHYNQIFQGISYPSFRALIYYVWHGRSILMDGVAYVKNISSFYAI
jgi:lysophospholipid acyltransferase (LPLAT)-like uncharacterized protein